MATGDRGYETVLMAGSTDEPDPLCVSEGTNNKASIRIKGRPMAQYVLDALIASTCISRISVVGLHISPSKSERQAPPIRYIANHQGIVDNLLAAVEGLPPEAPVLVASSDIPLLTPTAVEDLCQRAARSDSDICYSIVARDVMEARYPGSGRSFRHLREGDFAGGDLFIITPRLVRCHESMLRGLSEHRKSAWGMVRTLGLRILLRYATRRLSIAHLEAWASDFLGFACKAIVSPYPEIAMDVDKTYQLAMVRRILAASETS